MSVALTHKLNTADLFCEYPIAEQKAGTHEYIIAITAQHSFFCGMQAMARWTGLGYRVLGLAVGKLLPATAANKQQLSRLNLLTLKQHVSDLRMIGLAIIETQVRADAAVTIKQMQDRLLHVRAVF